MTGSGYGREKDILQIKEKHGQRPRYLGQSRVDMTLNHVRREQRRGGRGERIQGQQPGGTKENKVTKTLDYIGKNSWGTDWRVWCRGQGVSQPCPITGRD